MNKVTPFKKELESSLSMLEKDEWAVTSAREMFVGTLEPHEAFSAIMDVLNLAKEQKDGYAFCSCCWLAIQLAEKARTTEQPSGLQSILEELASCSAKFDSESKTEVEKVSKWFRV